MIKFYDNPDDFKSNKILCNAWVATAVIGAGVLGAGATIYASNQASNAQQDATAQAANLQREQYAQTRSDLAPYRDAGARATNELERRLPHLTSPIDVTEELKKPDSITRKAYDFNLTQGNKAVQNSAAARGLGVSGAALKGAANFTTGLVDNTYKTLFDMENTNRGNAYARLKGLVDAGVGAATGTGVLGEKSAYNAGQAMIGGGNAAAAGYNAMGGAINNAANNIGGYAAYRGLYGSPGGGGMPITDYSGVTPAQSNFWASGNVGPIA